MELPETLAKESYCRGYYGTVKHNVRAVYQRYFGWYDGNPANLDRLPSSVTAQKYVASMGGIEAVLQNADSEFESGEYRWVAELLNHAVFAFPEHRKARELQAACFEQLGFQAESAIWRNFYLSGAMELRGELPTPGTLCLADQLASDALTPEMVFDLLGVRLNAERASDKELKIVFEATDTNEVWTLAVENSALNCWPSPSDDAGLTIRGSWPSILGLVRMGKDWAVDKPVLGIEMRGIPERLTEFVAMLDWYPDSFALALPHRQRQSAVEIPRL